MSDVLQTIPLIFYAHENDIGYHLENELATRISFCLFLVEEENDFLLQRKTTTDFRAIVIALFIDFRGKSYQMTPLARWVLLATLFGHAMSVPARTQALENACVALCRAENAAANEDKVHVIPRRQFIEGRRGREADRLLGLCLERPQHSTICKIIVKSLREHRGCDCELIERSGIPRRNYISSSLLDDLVEDYSKISEAVQSQLQGNRANVLRSGSIRKLVEAESKRQLIVEREAFKYATSGSIMDTNEQHDSSASNSDDSEEVDWELWCMAQCDIGHGGSVCKCDIIP
ncbi:hypothetical protein KPH14_010245 [Odynerus spinipes]|uniref:Uncharacterized protein n=1 Tax=Odynerus spinipes TaxID=1348599 RepID=A0AAD9VTL5_9HYME|nr:hypothetical protein KPH14_010245 [Odynerus spinipes]